MKQEKGVFLKGVDVPPDVNRIMGHDSEGYYVLERVTIHTDGTPDEWVRTYYEPCPTSDGMNVSQVVVDEWIGERKHGRDGKTD